MLSQGVGGKAGMEAFNQIWDDYKSPRNLLLILVIKRVTIQG